MLFYVIKNSWLLFESALGANYKKKVPVSGPPKYAIFAWSNHLALFLYLCLIFGLYIYFILYAVKNSTQHVYYILMNVSKVVDTKSFIEWLH